MRKLYLVFLPVLLYLPKEKNDYDTIIRHAQVYDGSGGDAIRADIGIIADTIAFVGDLEHASAKTDVDARGLMLSPGLLTLTVIMQADCLSTVTFWQQLARVLRPS
jgi:N-acyl-D-aspartate/D-glutamate deacylase